MGAIAGIDEAGRGPVLGPMVMAIVACEPKDKILLQKMGVKDSKLLTPKKRNDLFRLIRKHFAHAIINVPVDEIDKHVDGKTSSLNRLEAITSGKLIRRICEKTSVSKVILDLPSKNKESYIKDVREKLSFPENAIPITAEYKADLNHIEVSAASILAKVTRDKALKTMEKKIGVQIGSGYPADPNTIKSLDENFKLLVKEKLVRMSWKTTKELIEKHAQRRLGDF
ncbi:ribonuclease HII [Candidatus Woesearchaeota archaeon]|nr:ribonuclease HII [Candidatus Woesearchaeota archaeon]